MSLALKFGNINDPNSISGFVYFDAVTDYNRRYSGKTTDHPIDAGASITDHFVSNNPRFRINAVISSVDLSPISGKLFIDNESPLNTNSYPDPVTVNNFFSNLTSVLPASVLQFVENGQFIISGGGSLRKNYKKEVSFLLENIIRGLYYNEQRKKWENRMTPITLYELEGETFSDAYTDLILVDISVTESVDNWDALNISLELEQVMFVSLESVEAPQASKKTVNKGKVINKPQPVPTTEEVRKPDQPRPTVIDKLKKVKEGIFE